MGWLLNSILKASKSPAMEGREQEFILATYRSIENTLERRKRGLETIMTKQELENAKNLIDFHKTLAESRDRLRESVGKDRRVQIQSLASVERSLIAAMGSIARTADAPNGVAIQNYRDGSSGGNVKDGLSAFFGSYFEEGGTQDSTNPNMWASMLELKRLVVEAVGKDLDERGQQQLLSDEPWVERDAGGNLVGGLAYRAGVTDDATLGNIEYFENQAKSMRAGWDASMHKMAEERKAITSLRDGITGLSPDESADGLIQKASADYDTVTKAAGDEITGHTPEDLLTKIKAYEGEDASIKRMEKLAENLAGGIMNGGPDIREQVATIVMNPGFREWATENGYTDLGQGTWDESGKFLGYAPGKDDAKAMLLANQQMKHPHPLLWPKTGRLVEVTVKEPDPKVAPFVDPATRTVSYIEADGAKQWLSPVDAAALVAEREGAAEVAMDDSTGNLYVHQGIRTQTQDATGVWKDVEGVLPEGLTWNVAGIKDADGALKLASMSDFIAATPDVQVSMEPDVMAAWDVKTAAPLTVDTVYRGETGPPRWTPRGKERGLRLHTGVEGGQGVFDEAEMKKRGASFTVKELGTVEKRTKKKGPVVAAQTVGGHRAEKRADKAAAPTEKPAAAPAGELAKLAELPAEVEVPEAEVAKPSEKEARAEASVERQRAAIAGQHDEAKARVAAAGREVRRREIGAAAPGVLPGIIGTPVESSAGAPSPEALVAPVPAAAPPVSAMTPPALAVMPAPVVKRRKGPTIGPAIRDGAKPEGELPKVDVARAGVEADKVAAKPAVSSVPTPEAEARRKAAETKAKMVTPEEKRAQMKGAMATLEEGTR